MTIYPAIPVNVAMLRWSMGLIMRKHTLHNGTEVVSIREVGRHIQVLTKAGEWLTVTDQDIFMSPIDRINSTR